MTDDRTPSGYIHDPNLREHVSEKPVGYGIFCRSEKDGFLTLEDHRRPFATRVQAEKICELNNSLGLCDFPHQVVRVWATYAGKMTNEAKARSEEARAGIETEAPEPAFFRKRGSKIAHIEQSRSGISTLRLWGACGAIGGEDDVIEDEHPELCQRCVAFWPVEFLHLLFPEPEERTA